MTTQNLKKLFEAKFPGRKYSDLVFDDEHVRKCNGWEAQSLYYDKDGTVFVQTDAGMEICDGSFLYHDSDDNRWYRSKKIVNIDDKKGNKIYREKMMELGEERGV